ncbi:MAG: DUF5615 family PIN-like protein [Acidobacteriota bacterium]
MRLKLDENFERRGAEVLAAAGHDVATVPAENLCRASDQEVVRVCRAEGRCLVTLDLDFGNPLVFKPSDYPGLAVVRLRGKAEPTDLERALRVLAAGLEGGVDRREAVDRGAHPTPRVPARELSGRHGRHGFGETAFARRSETVRPPSPTAGTPLTATGGVASRSQRA